MGRRASTDTTTRAAPVARSASGTDLLTFDFHGKPAARSPAPPPEAPAPSVKEAIIRWLEQQL